MKISTTCSYALSAMAQVAAQPTAATVSSASICEAANLPGDYVLQVLRRLVTEKLLVSVRGTAGGYKLGRPASEIPLLEVVEAIDGPIGTTEPMAIEGMSPESVRTVDEILAGIADDTRKRLASVTLADLRTAKAA